MDGAFLKAQREESKEFEVRLGLLYSGKELVSTTAKHAATGSGSGPGMVA